MIFFGTIRFAFCGRKSLIIELDGSRHYDPAEREKDRKRTESLESRGLLAVRIPNNEVNKNFRGVCEYIDRCVKRRLHIDDA